MANILFGIVLSLATLLRAASGYASGVYTGSFPETIGPSEGFGSSATGSGMPAEYFQESKGSSKLFDAVTKNDYHAVKQLILQGVDVNARDAQGDTALHLAQDAEMVRLLVENNAEVNSRNTEFGMTPIFSKSKETALVLIAAGADLGARSKKGNTPLIWYTYNNYLEGIRLLLDRGANINVCNTDNQSALDIAEKFADADTVQYLKSKGARSCRRK